MLRGSGRRTSLAVFIALVLAGTLPLLAVTPVVHAAGPTVYSSKTVVQGSAGCNPNYFGPYTFTCAFNMATQSGDLLVVAFQIAYYDGVTYNTLSLTDSIGTSFTLAAFCNSGCYTIGEGFQTGIYYGFAPSSSSSDTVTLTEGGTNGYSGAQSAASTSLEGYDVNFAGISGTPALSASAVFNCQYQDYYNSNNCSGSSVPMNTPRVAAQTFGSNSFMVAAILSTGNGMRGGSGFQFVSTACVNYNYCYGAETASGGGSVTSPTNFPFSASNVQGVYWGWAESAAVFTPRTGFGAPPPGSGGNSTVTHTLTTYPLPSAASGYALWVPIVTAVLGLALGFVLALGLMRTRKPSGP